MNYDDFWDGDPQIAADYRNAYLIKQKKDNFNAWREGLYFYDALLCAAPAFRDMVKSNKPVPYLDKPYPLNEKERQENEEARRKSEMENIKKAMMAKMAAINKKFQNKRGE